MTTEAITTRTGKIWLRADGIVQAVLISPNSQHSLEDAQANIAAVAALHPAKRRPMLIDMRAAQKIEREVRVYYSSVEVSTARALLVGSPVSQVIANFFISLGRHPVPTRLFTSETEAVAWLKNFIE